MTIRTDKDTPPPVMPEPDAHGRAALLLAEGTLHALVETSTLSCAEAVDIVRTAIEVRREAPAPDVSEQRRRGVLELLSRIRTSLETDLAATRPDTGLDR